MMDDRSCLMDMILKKNCCIDDDDDLPSFQVSQYVKITVLHPCIAHKDPRDKLLRLTHLPSPHQGHPHENQLPFPSFLFVFSSFLDRPLLTISHSLDVSLLITGPLLCIRKEESRKESKSPKISSHTLQGVS